MILSRKQEQQNDYYKKERRKKEGKEGKYNPSQWKQRVYLKAQQKSPEIKRASEVEMPLSHLRKKAAHFSTEPAPNRVLMLEDSGPGYPSSACWSEHL